MEPQERRLFSGMDIALKTSRDKNSKLTIKEMAKLTIIRFDLNRPDGYDVNRIPEGVEGNPQLMMWKELCRSGVYETGGVKHNIDRAFLQNIVDTFWERNKKGIEVPCPVGHTHDPESKRGRVVYVELREGKDGTVSLYGIIEFVSFEAKRTLCNSGVSIEAPEVVTDGDGETHKYGLEHVAFTDYPVVAGMDGFRDVVFSIYKKKEKKMGKKRKKFSEETQFETCPNCGHEFDDDVGMDDDVVQSRRYGRRFADDTAFDDDIGMDDDEVSCGRFGRRFDEDAQFDDDVVQSRRYGRRYGRRFDEDSELEDDSIEQGRRYGRRYGRRFDEDAQFDDLAYDDDAQFDDDIEEVQQSRRYGRRYGRRFDEDAMLDDDIQQGRRCSRRFDEDAQFDDEELDADEDIVQGRRYGRRYSRRFDEDAQFDDDIEQGRRYGRRYGRRFDEDAELEDDIEQGRRYGRRYGRRFDEDAALEDDIQQSRRYGRRYGRRFDEDASLEDDTESEDNIVQSRRYGRRFADEVQYDELPANALAVEQEKRYGDKKFSLGDAETVSANILKENRELQVQNLLSAGKINRIQARQILDRFCNQKAISFSVNTGDNSEFKNVVELMNSGIGADYSEKTGVQFSNPNKEEGTGNELLEAVEKRVAEKTKG